MAAKTPLGHVECPECGFEAAEIRADKNGHLYRYCPDCSAQYFTRGELVREKNLRARMRPVTEPVTEAGQGAPRPPVAAHPIKPQPAPKPPAAAQPIKPQPVPKRVGLLLEA